MHPTKFRFIRQSSFRGEHFFRNQTIRNKNCLWQPCLLTDRDEMSNRNRWLSIDASYQVSVHLARRFQRRRFFKNRPIRNKNCLWRPCLLMNQDEMSNLYFSIDASLPSFSSFGWGVSKEKIKMWKVNGQDDGRRTPSDGKSSHCL
jgi:hypothetical protein